MRWHAKLLLGLLVTAPAVGATTFGALEHVRLSGPPAAIEVVSRLDPAASRTTLRVSSLKYVLHGDGTWVRFQVDSGDVVTLRHVTYERRVEHDREVPLRDGGVRHEPEVSLDLCIGDQPLTTQVTLLTRNGYVPVLTLGQPDLKRLDATVDAKAQFRHEPSCAPPPAAATTVAKPQ